jgi:hypothetical protein
MNGSGIPALLSADQGSPIGQSGKVKSPDITDATDEHLPPPEGSPGKDMPENPPLVKRDASALSKPPPGQQPPTVNQPAATVPQNKRPFDDKKLMEIVKDLGNMGYGWPEISNILKGSGCTESEIEGQLKKKQPSEIVQSLEDSGFIWPEIEKALKEAGHEDSKIAEVKAVRDQNKISHLSDSGLKESVKYLETNKIPFDGIRDLLLEMGEKENRGIPGKYVLRAEKLGLLPRNQKTITLADDRKIEIFTNSPDSARTIGETLSEKKILSDEEVGNFQVEMMDKASDLGFGLVRAGFVSGIGAGYGNIEGHVTGNEEKRKERNFIKPFQACQPPDQARKIGAEALVGINEMIKTIEESANGAGEGAGKKIAQAVLDFCANEEFYIAIPEACIGGNNLGVSRSFNPLMAGPSIALKYLLFDENDGVITAKSLRECAEKYGKEWVDKAMQSYYKITTSTTDRPGLKKAYENFYRENDHGQCPDLEGMIFNSNGELHELYKKREDLIKRFRLSSVDHSTAASRADEDPDLNSDWQNYLKNHTITEEDGGLTVNLGHVKIMINPEQRSRLTLKAALSL